MSSGFFENLISKSSATFSFVWLCAGNNIVDTFSNKLIRTCPDVNNCAYINS